MLGSLNSFHDQSRIRLRAFNSLCWVHDNELKELEMEYDNFQFPLLGSRQWNCDAAVNSIIFQFPLLGSSPRSNRIRLSLTCLSIPFVGFGLYKKKIVTDLKNTFNSLCWVPIFIFARIGPQGIIVGGTFNSLCWVQYHSFTKLQRL